MKLKYYLRGLGTGIIFTAIVLMVIYSYRTTDRRIMDRARELGMIMADETSDSKENETPTKAGNLTENETPSQEEESDRTHSGEETSEEDTSTEETSDEKLSGEEPASDETVVELTIYLGMYSESVCQKLYEYNVVDNAAAFNEYLTKTGIADRLTVGTYRFKTGMTYEEAAEVLKK